MEEIKHFRLAILVSHPIQYFAPLFRRLAREPELDLTVYYCSSQGAEEYVDQGFEASFQWDIPLLDGYHFQLLPNLRQRDHVGVFFQSDEPIPGRRVAPAQGVKDVADEMLTVYSRIGEASTETERI